MEGKINKETPELILIEWVDAQTIYGELMDIDTLDIKPSTAYMIGFLVKENEKDYYLAGQVWDTWQCKYIHIIPKKSVTKVYLLKEKEIISDSEKKEEN